VRFEDASMFTSYEAACGNVPLQQPDVINVYYSFSAPMFIGGINCSASSIIMHFPMHPLGGGMTLAHEIGHAFSLHHDPHATNFMVSMAPVGTGVNAGQIFHVHFDTISALNAVFHLRPRDVADVCGLPPETWTW